MAGAKKASLHSRVPSKRAHCFMATGNTVLIPPRHLGVDVGMIRLKHIVTSKEKHETVVLMSGDQILAKLSYKILTSPYSFFFTTCLTLNTLYMIYSQNILLKRQRKYTGISESIYKWLSSK